MKALIIIDMQQDFCPGGALAVQDGDTIIPVINQLATRFPHIILTQDWHPEGHSSFASVHEGKAPYDTVQMNYGEQVLWPDHCVQGNKGADFHPDLEVNNAQLIIRKGFRKDVDSYSVFYENDHKTATGLAGYLKDCGIKTVYLTGLATDFCVKWSAIDGIKEGLDVYVITDAVKGINLNGSEDAAWAEMREAGIKEIQASEV